MRSQIPAHPDRRALLKLLAAGAGVLGAGRVSLLAAAASSPDAGLIPLSLQPGEFFWRPELAKDGPVVIIASIPKQLVYVYRKGILLGLSTCSTGMPGYSTPAGLFNVINKFKVHRSIKYRDDMPFTMRLTKKGIALHAGDVPGYPVSHGCVHLPLSFADALFGMTATGTTVVIGGRDTHPLVGGPGITPVGGAGNIIAARQAARSLAPPGPDADTSILVSAADRRLYVVQDGTIITQGAARIDDAEEPLGTNVFVWRGGDPGGTGSIWKGNGFEPVPGGAVVADAASLARLDGTPKVMETIGKVLHSGTVLLTTDEPLSSVRERAAAPRRASRTKRYGQARTSRKRRRSG